MNDIDTLLEKRRKNLIISLIVLPIYTIALEAYLLSLLYVPGPCPSSPHPILICAFITAIVCAPMILLILAFAWALFTIEKKTGEAIKIEKYIVVFLVLFFTTSFVAVSTYNVMECSPPSQYYCELNATENSTAWTLTVSNLKSDDGLSIPLVSYQLRNGESYGLLEHGFLYQISDFPSQGYNITFIDNDQNNRFNNGDFFIIQKGGGINGTVNNSDYFYLKLEDQSAPLTKIKSLSQY